MAPASLKIGYSLAAGGLIILRSEGGSMEIERADLKKHDDAQADDQQRMQAGRLAFLVKPKIHPFTPIFGR